MESERLREHLDGDLPREALTPEERQEADRFLASFAALREAGPVGGEMLTARIVSAVAAASAGPRVVRLRPLTAVAASLALLAAGAGLASWLGGRATPSAAARANVVRFVLVDRGARELTVTGDFAGWSSAGIPMRDERGDGVWIAEVPLAPGVHQYLFIVDGREWRPDPAAPLTADDGFGRRNSVVVVPA